VAQHGCEFCAEDDAAGRDVVASTDLFHLGMTPSHDVPGWLILWLRRHVESAAQLSDDEAAELGRQITRVSRALQQVVDAEKIYVVSLGENHPHFHVLLAARTAAMADSRGPGLLADFEAFRDRRGALIVAGRVQTVLSAI
jgi:diadenosine tetraphosphate (Ap4A) HIT family hydrolase